MTRSKPKRVSWRKCCREIVKIMKDKQRSGAQVFYLTLGEQDEIYRLATGHAGKKGRK